MKNSTTNRFLPLPPTSYQCPFSEEARTCQSNPIDTYLTSLPCPTNGEHFSSTSSEDRPEVDQMNHLAPYGQIYAVVGML
jgi:hypothetical protein